MKKHLVSFSEVENGVFCLKVSAITLKKEEHAAILLELESNNFFFISIDGDAIYAEFRGDHIKANEMRRKLTSHGWSWG